MDKTSILGKTDTLVLERTAPREFTMVHWVFALPSEKLVYWSYKRSNANKFIKKAIEKFDIKVEYGHDIPYKSLDYNYNYRPSDYAFGFSLYLISFLFLLHEQEFEGVLIFLFASTACSWCYIKSKDEYNKFIKNRGGNNTPATGRVKSAHLYTCATKEGGLNMGLYEQQKENIKKLEKKIKYLNIIDAPAMIVIGLGMFSKLNHDPASLHPLLENSNLVNGALAIAVPWAVICGYKSIKLSLEVYKLKKGLSI